MRLARSVSATFAVLILAGSSAQAQTKLAPPPFSVPGSTVKAVFVDFSDAVYDITYDIAQRETRVKATIHFNAEQEGLPAFDFNSVRAQVQLDGAAVTTTAVNPATDSDGVIVVKSPVTPGDHELVLDYKMSGAYAPTYRDNTVQSGFFTDDSVGRYLQSYLPSNFEFDQYKMAFNVEILGLSGEQALFTNGALKQIDANHWTVDFPSYFNGSSVYFHTLPKSAVEILEFTADNGGGQTIPGIVYQKRSNGETLSRYRDIATKTIADLAGRFGPFAHPSVTIYAQASGGGMEYHGATVSSAWALPHELAHSFFGRGVMPANGNAGWIDEAMATLTGGPYTPDASNIEPTNMSKHSPYYTREDNNGYVQGMNLLAHFGNEFHTANAGLSIEGFLQGWYKTHVLATVDVQMLQDDMEAYSGLSLTNEFASYVYGVGAKNAAPRLITPGAPVHRVLTPDEFKHLQ